MTLLNNAKWVSISQFGRIIIQLLSLTILTRLIPPADYGLMALGTVVMNFVLIIRDLGTASAIIQRKELDEDILNSVFWLNIAMGMMLFIVINILTPYISALFDNPKLEEVLFLLCFCFPIASAGSAHQALMERNSNFKLLAAIELFSALTGFFTAITIAIKGGGVFSLIYQVLITTLISSSLIIITSSWRPALRFKFQGIRKILGFSGRLTVFNIVNYFSRNADSMIISRKFDASVLGSYSIAYRIMLFPLQSLSFIASRSLYPILSRNQDDISLIRKIYLKTIFTISTITIPLMVGVAYLREPFIHVALGPQWETTASLLLWLAPTGIIQSILSCSGSILMATNNAKTLMFLGFYGAFVQISAFALGAFFTIEIFAFLYFISNVLNAIVVLYFTFKCIELKIQDFLLILLIQTLSCMLMLAVNHFVSKTTLLSSFSEIYYLLFQCGIGVISYFIFYILLLKTLLHFSVISKKMLPLVLIRLCWV